MVKIKSLLTSDGRPALRVARENGISQSALTSRLATGWDLEDAVARPMDQNSGRIYPSQGRLARQNERNIARIFAKEMSMIAEFNLLDGNLVTINLAQVDYFQAAGDNTLIVFADGRTLTVVDSYDAVAEILNPERQAGD